ncbi:AFL083Cp [Eremothecium gossypii ATCC 10895]|uniref:AFL083Cp n=1 Tax=Eremothecium gossypii (strain ATCC 10895 / CBS 109.51 / FGSC 9923 / NRRL Y-1056) TaxID=284811 RepID=Q755A8_EREGS|nr:AFL083Cp [Eremothecium gossypii ATCC 10895]AAS53289.1 AFL083Cp [Eremothecium gossypii ATCC 10895]AEY97599.1 FAFL083Cp [Eremothecium gossypii FDAG1]
MSVVLDRGAFLSQDRDYNHATDGEYKRLRDLADQAFKKRAELSHQSQQAYKQGDGARAKELSEQAKRQLEAAERYNMQAAEYVFTSNNADSGSDEIDLHGLYVKEAQWIMKKRIAAGVQSGEPRLRVIVGKGLHSANGVAKIRPAVEELCSEAGLRSYVDSKNAGVLIVDLENANVPASWDTTPYSGQLQPSKPPAAHTGGQPQAGYQAPAQPQYQQQPAAGQAPGQGAQNGPENPLVAALLTFFCQTICKLK